MSTQLKALLYRYYITYRRFPKRLASDFLLAGIIGATIALSKLEYLGIFAALVYLLTLPFTFLATVRTMIGEIVSEKSAGIKEYLKLNGLSIYTYQLYLFSLTAIKTLIFTVCIVAGIVLRGFIESITEEDSILQITTNKGEMIISYVLCALATISFILAMSTLFSDPKVGSSISAFIYAALSLGSNIVLISGDPMYFYLISLFPQSGLTMSLLVEITETHSTSAPPFSRAIVNWIILFDFFFYMLLYVYLDQVIKDENGVRKPLLFFLDIFKKKRRPARLDDSENMLNQDDVYLDPMGVNRNTESSAVYNELLDDENIKSAIKVKHISKQFGDFTAVDSISFPIYEAQIFCLLGHNGAGKTTTIRMMTGMLEADRGEITYDGQSLLENLEEVRKKIGICTQQDILFEKLKVSEHLELIAKLRHVPKDQIPLIVEETINKMGLVNERDHFPEQLSGGTKRKLSLAMAIIGNTRFIFLDEPTSGMDPQNRRVMWQHLKDLRNQGITILLTTHHLDEADELADRIAMMSRGKLLALGTSEFFKKNFGVGYHLNITPKSNENISTEDFLTLKPRLVTLISNIIPDAKFDEQTAREVLRCSLPFSTQREFPKLFSELERIDTIKISVEMNTLEDVFVNIGLNEDQLLLGESINNNIDLNIQPPACLSDRAVYSFYSQTSALAKRRVYLLIRSWRNIFLMTLPLLLIFIGALSSLGIDQPEGRFAFFDVVTVIAFSLNIGAYCSFPVYEREENQKYIMDVMGLRNLPYWIGNLMVDLAAISLMNFVVYLLYAWIYSGINPLMAILVPKSTEFLAVIIPHGFALVTLSYAWSFYFDKGLSAVKYFPLIYFFALFLIGSIIVVKVQTPHYPENKRPLLGAVVGVICPTILFMEFLAGQFDGLEAYQVMLFELGYAVFYFLLTLWLKRGQFKGCTNPSRQGHHVPEQSDIPIDLNDINDEKNRTQQSIEDPIKVMDLTKTYDNGHTAVRDITFGVEPGQIFGLLGPNGAGKSTTFNILTAAISKSQGSVQLLDREVGSNMPEVYENVGICPQFNALWSNLTVREHLTLFASLKGIKEPNLTSVIEYYLDALHLREYVNKQAGQLSGGNKRKLSVANAFIGSAYLLFLDEPSTGVDPLAKRFLWNSIQQVLKMRKASVVLTTHSMYEAESLCHKIGILINGKFVCIGPTQYLKDKYSQGYKISISLLPNSPDPMSKIMELFPQANRVQDASFVQQIYHLPLQGFLFSEGFKNLEDLKQANIIRDFSIYNTTLEQIFIYFSKFQINNQNILQSVP